jgi:pilus assembly protein CpaF
VSAEALRAAVFEHDELADLDPAARRLALRSLAAEVLEPDEVAGAVAELADLIDGFGPLSELMADESVTDILVNGPDEVWVDRATGLARVPIGFADGRDLFAFVERTLGRAGARADMSRPIADARLHDGSRIHVVMPPIAPDGPLISIRRHRSAGWSLGELSALGMLSIEQATRLARAVGDRATIAVGGPTGSGKTTLLNALLREVAESERIVTIEETPELTPRCAHAVALVARPPNAEGQGEVDLQMLARAALRMRPDRIVIGEVRGAEALVALDAFSTGHKGSFVTVHAGTAAEALDRLVSLALQAGSGAREESLRMQVRRAFDLVVQVDRRAGARRISEVVEV